MARTCDLKAEYRRARARAKQEKRKIKRAEMKKKRNKLKKYKMRVSDRIRRERGQRTRFNNGMGQEEENLPNAFVVNFLLRMNGEPVTRRKFRRDLSLKKLRENPLIVSAPVSVSPASRNNSRFGYYKSYVTLHKSEANLETPREIGTLENMQLTDKNDVDMEENLF